MKSLGTGFFVLVFAAIALFGFFAMNHNSASHVTGCLVEKIQASVCPTAEENVLGFVSFHLGIIKNFSAVFSNTAFSLAASIALVLVFVILIFPVLGMVTNLAGRVSFSELYRSSSCLRNKKLNRWLSFHENSPTLRLRREF